MNNLIDQLRSPLIRFVNQRERAYKTVQQRGTIIPGMRQKREAIEAIRNQLDYLEGKSMRAHILCISALVPKIQILLPYEFHDDPKQQTIRQRILELLRYCDDQVNAKPLFTSI